MKQHTQDHDQFRRHPGNRIPSLFRNRWPAVPLALAAMVLAFGLSAGPAPAAGSEPEGSIRVTVNGIVCAFCVQGIERHFRQRQEVKSIFISLTHSVLLLELKPDRPMTDELIAATTERAGYDVVKIERIETPFAKERERLRTTDR